MARERDVYFAKLAEQMAAAVAVLGLRRGEVDGLQHPSCRRSSCWSCCSRVILVLGPLLGLPRLRGVLDGGEEGERGVCCCRPSLLPRRSLRSATTSSRWKQASTKDLVGELEEGLLFSCAEVA